MGDDQVLISWSVFGPGQSLLLLVMELPSWCSLAPLLPLKLLHKHRDLKGEAVIQEVS